MIIYNHRMLEGNPIHYYQPSSPIQIPQSIGFTHFDRFQNSLSPGCEEFTMPNSPNESQSDSDNSVSSLDVHPKGIKSKTEIANQREQANIQCRWSSCGITFESLDQLSTHVSQVHASSGPGGLFYCGWEGCLRNNKGFNARYKMLVHVRTHTNEKPHQCYQCDKAFSRAENLKIHSRSHSGEKPYTCPVPGCHKAYSNSSDRFKHTRTHQVEKPYQCKIPGCPKRYTDPSSLRKHIKTYKHYVNENSPLTPALPKEKSLDIQNKSASRTESCNCTHTCCKSTTGLLKLDAYVDISNKSISAWENLVHPLISEPKIFKPYELKEEEMDIDLPLDLSMRHN